jgi:hypothetical protein
VDFADCDRSRLGPWTDTTKVSDLATECRSL